MYTDQDSETIHFLLLIKVACIHHAYSLLHHVFQATALFNADQHDEADLLLKELAAGCPNADIRACHIVEVSIMQTRWVINTNLCNSHIRHIYVFNSESKPWMAHITTKPPTISLPLSTAALYHQNWTSILCMRI
jgi:hypothetical protein